MLLSRKVRVYPNDEQAKQMLKTANCMRFVYNWALTTQKENHEAGEKFISNFDLAKQMTQLKHTDYQWLKEVSSNAITMAIFDACDAYKRFFKKLAKYPRYKHRGCSLSFYSKATKVKDGKLVFIEKTGWMRSSEQLPVDTKLSNPRVSFDGKYWYISVAFEHDLIEEELTENVLGIDLGIKNLAVCSDGEVFKNINRIKRVKTLEKRIKRLQRQVSRKYTMNGITSAKDKTKNIVKLEAKIMLLHRKLKNIRKTYNHQVTTKIVKTRPKKIVLEDLNVSQMLKNKHLAKKIANQAFFEIRTMLEYKSKRRGIIVEFVPRFFPSSKQCSSCHHVKNDLKLTDRVYNCICGLSIDRDLNAALNLANYIS